MTAFEEAKDGTIWANGYVVCARYGSPYITTFARSRSAAIKIFMNDQGGEWVDHKRYDGKHTRTIRIEVQAR